FPADQAVSTVSGATADHNGTKVGTAELLLQTSTEYFWRVTATQTPALEPGWARPTNHFKTDARRPTLLEPLDCGRDSLGVDPWPVNFSWKPVIGATQYQFTVANDEQFDDVIVDYPTPATSEQLVMMIGSEYWWRVQGIRDDTHYGEPAVQKFTTKI